MESYVPGEHHGWYGRRPRVPTSLYINSKCVCLSVCVSVTNYYENTVRARKLKIGIEVDMGMVEVKIIVSKFIDQREPLQEPKRAEMSQK